MTSKVDICNLALAILGDKNTVEDIDNPKKSEEVVFKKWFDITLRSSLRRNMPSFAIKRELWAKTNYVPAFGYKNTYLYPNDCVKILGIGNVYEEVNNYSVEGNYLLCDEVFDAGIPVRYICHVTNTTLFPPDYVELLAYELAYNICANLTRDVSLLQNLSLKLKEKRFEYASVDSQENKPIRVSHSKYDRTGRTYNFMGKK